nr:A disintegrin and metalloproteinase with thrombospondin motifs 3-like isoform X2 [Hydra vulgaris]
MWSNMHFILSFFMLEQFGFFIKADLLFANGEANWSIWKEWSACTVTCGDGVSLRTRICNKSFFQNSCPGVALEVLPCNYKECPKENAVCSTIKASDCSNEIKDSVSNILEESSYNDLLAEVSKWSLERLSLISECTGDIGNLDNHINELKNHVSSLTNANKATSSVLNNIKVLVGCSKDTNGQTLYERCQAIVGQNNTMSSEISKLNMFLDGLENVKSQCQKYVRYSCPHIVS